MGRNYYMILKVNSTATAEELKKSYKSLAMKWHPDRNMHRKEEAEAEFKIINEAYDVLSDPTKRKIYDTYGQYPINSRNKESCHSDKDEKAGGAVETKLVCSLEELYIGSRKKFKISRVIRDEFGKLKNEEELLRIDIKPGWKKGTKITFPEKGNQHLGPKPDDIIFVVEEKPHSIFKRDGNDLVVTQKILLVEALIGKTLVFKTLDGRNLKVEVTDVVKPDSELVVPNEGMPILKQPGKKGNLRINFDIIFPTKLRDQQKFGLRMIMSSTSGFPIFYQR